MRQQWVACDRRQATGKPGLGRPQRLPPPIAFLSCGKKLTLPLLPFQTHGAIRFGILSGSLHCLLFQTQAFRSIHTMVVAITMCFDLLLPRRLARGCKLLSPGGAQNFESKRLKKKNFSRTNKLKCPVLLSFDR